MLGMLATHDGLGVMSNVEGKQTRSKHPVDRIVVGQQAWRQDSNQGKDCQDAVTHEYHADAATTRVRYDTINESKHTQHTSTPTRTTRCLHPTWTDRTSGSFA